MTSKWQTLRGYKGKILYVFNDHLEAVVWEDILARTNRFVVLEMSRST